MSHPIVRILGKVFPFLFYGLLTIFLVQYLRSIDFAQFKNANFVWQYLLIASVLSLATRFWQTYIWLSLLKGLGATGLRENWRQFLYVYAKSWLGRYIPGTAPWILGKIYFASKHGVSKNKLAVSSLLEGGLQIAVIMAISFLMLFSDTRLDVIDIRLKILMTVVLFGCLVSILPPVFNRIIAILYRIVKRKKFNPEHNANSKTIFRGAAFYAIGGIVSGAALFFVAKAIYPELGYNNALFVMGVGNLAGAVSMLAVFAPSGIGVREGIQLTLLSLIMPTELALLVTITTRLWGVVMDFAFFAIAKMLNRSEDMTTHNFSIS